MHNSFLKNIALLFCFFTSMTATFATIDYTTIAENVNGIVPAAFGGTNGMTYKTASFLFGGAVNTNSNIHTSNVFLARGVSYNIEIGGHFVDACTKVEIYSSPTATVPRTTLDNKADNDPTDKIKTQSSKIWLNLGNVPLTEGSTIVLKLRYLIETNGPDVIVCRVDSRGTITIAKWVGTTLPTYSTNSVGQTVEELKINTNYRLQLTVTGLPADNFVSNQLILHGSTVMELPTFYDKIGTVTNGTATFEGVFTARTNTNVLENTTRSLLSDITRTLLQDDFANLTADQHDTEGALKLQISTITPTNTTTHTTDLSKIVVRTAPLIPVQNPTGTNLVPTHGGVTFAPVLTPSGSIDAILYRNERYLQVTTGTCAGDPIANSTLVVKDALQGEQRVIVEPAGNVPWGVKDEGSNPSTNYPTFTVKLFSNGILQETQNLNTLPSIGHQQLYPHARPAINVYVFPLIQGNKCYLKDTNNGRSPINTAFEVQVDTANAVQESNETDNKDSF